MTRTSRHHLARLIAIGIAVQAASGVPQAQAGILDFLFGRSPEPVAVAPAPAPNFSSEFRRTATRPAPSSVRNAATVRTAANVALCCKDGGDPMHALMSDPTLRDGDAVMTDHGMTVFRGSGHDRVHQPQDFVAIAKAENVPPAERLRISALAANYSH
jgi:hypothetical protein